MDKEEKDIQERLVTAKTVERIEPFLNFFDDHGHLQNMQNWNCIIHDGWDDMLDGIVYLEHEPLHWLEKADDDENAEAMDLKGKAPNSPDTNWRRKRAQCKYCTQKGHFNFECHVSHKLCHFQGCKKCLVPMAHRAFHPHNYLVCTYDGLHSTRLWKQRVHGGVE